MDGCVFCKIVKGKIPSAKVYEDDKILAFLDIGPVNKGHTLVIPKQHYETMLDLPDKLLKEMIIAVKKMVQAIKEGVNADGVNLLMSNYKAAGQVVPHAHFHILPRFSNDGLKHWPQGKYLGEEMNRIKEKIVSKL